MSQVNYTDACLRVTQLEDLKSKLVLEKVEKHGFAAIRGLFKIAELDRTLAIIKQEITNQAINPAFGESPRSIMNNFQKIVVGGGAQQSFYVPRCVRVAYNPIWAEDIYEMRAHFITLAKVRNIIQEKALNYALDNIAQDGFWTASRLQHYPAGGGFFMKHRDAVLEKHTKLAGMLKFIQIILLVTQKGEDFEAGGAFIELDDKHINLEDYFGKGDVIIYDGRTIHGVDDIDPHRVLNFSNPNGRVAGLASLYTDMSKGKK